MSLDDDFYVRRRNCPTAVDAEAFLAADVAVVVAQFFRRYAADECCLDSFESMAAILYQTFCK